MRRADTSEEEVKKLEDIFKIRGPFRCFTNQMNTQDKNLGQSESLIDFE